MAQLDGVQGLGTDLEALERSLGDTASMASAFDAQLREVKAALTDTTRDLGSLERGFSGGLKKALDGVVLDGGRLSDALAVLGKSMINTVYGAAVTPVTSQLGSLMSEGLNSLVSGLMPFAKGGAFTQGRVMPFAKGGVVSSPVSFPMRGATGLMGEAGPEAIMPLTRGADGRLGVQAEGGRSVNVTMNISTSDVQGFQRSQGQIAAQLTRVLGRGQRNR